MMYDDQGDQRISKLAQMQSADFADGAELGGQSGRSDQCPPGHPPVDPTVSDSGSSRIHRYTLNTAGLA